MMKESHIDLYMELAANAARHSHAIKLKVGCICVTDDHQIISIGYNGTPSGWDNCCEYHDDKFGLITKHEVIHAEANCISKLATSTISSVGSNIFCTHAPCMDCAKLIYGAKIKRVYYSQLYRSLDGIDFLTKVGIEVIRWNHQLH